MADNDIIKALNGADGLEHISIYCADNNGEDVTSIKIVDIIDLINRQKAEIERLTTLCTKQNEELDRLQKVRANILKVMKENISQTKTEAIKEFAERLKGKSHISLNQCGEMKPLIYFDDIDNLVKEMTEVSE